MSLDLTVKVTDLIMIAAVLLGPIVAVQLAEFLRHRKDEKDRRQWCFRTLMATRNAGLASAHVEALNLVDMSFHTSSKADLEIRDKWKLYIAHLGDKSYPAEVWGVRQRELFEELLFLMSRSLGYSFDRSHIKTGTYYPSGYSNYEAETQETRRLLLEVLRNERSVKINTSIVPPDDEELRKRFLESGALMQKFMAGEVELPVKVSGSNG